MVLLRIVRHDRNDQVLAECESTCVPASGEVLQLDTVDEKGMPARPSTLWRVVSVTLHVPSVHSAAPLDGGPLRVRRVEVNVLPDSSLEPQYVARAAQVLSESRM
jgi:hypothetical protein